jgi:hypothetical protein
MNKRTENRKLLFIAIIIFFWTNGLGFVFFNLNENFKILQLISLVVMTTVFTVMFSSKKNILSNYYTSNLLKIVLIVFSISLFNSAFGNGNDFYRATVQMLPFIGFLILPILMNFNNNKYFVNRVNKLIVLISLIVIVVYSFSYYFFGDSIDLIFVSHSTRLGINRVTNPISTLSIYTLFYCFLKLNYVRGKEKYLYLTTFSTIIFYYVFIDMGRRSLIAISITLLLYIFMNLNKRKLRNSILYILSTIILFIYLFNLEFNSSISRLFSSIFTEEIDTLLVRIDGIKYFMLQFEISNYLGIGLVERVAKLGFHSGDHGFFAVIYQFGVIGIIFTISILFKLFKDISFIKKFGDTEYKIIADAIMLFFIFNIFAFLQIFWNQRISIYTGMILFMTWQMKKNILDTKKT